MQDDRLVGVYDPTVAVPAEPVATTHCWPADLTLPGGAAVTSWAISGVTVSQTHRRRGIARALIEAELRTAAALGLPIAMLTVSESTIYARFGFSPAAFARDLTIVDPPRALDRARADRPRPPRDPRAAARRRATRSSSGSAPRRPGEVGYPATSNCWLRQIGLGIGDDNAKNLRIVRYDDADGTPQGFAVYQLVEDETDFADHTLKLHTLVAATTDAYAGLWRFVLEMDLVSTVTAHLRPVDEPLRWMIDDFRAVHVDELDHLWVRVLDVPAALAARTYGVAGRVVLARRRPAGLRRRHVRARRRRRRRGHRHRDRRRPRRDDHRQRARLAAAGRGHRPHAGWPPGSLHRRRRTARRDVPLPRRAVPQHLVLSCPDSVRLGAAAGERVGSTPPGPSRGAVALGGRGRGAGS